MDFVAYTCISHKKPTWIFFEQDLPGSCIAYV